MSRSSWMVSLLAALCGCATSGTHIADEKPVPKNPRFSKLAVGVQNDSGSSGACCVGGATSTVPPMTRVFLSWSADPASTLDIAGFNKDRQGDDPGDELAHLERLSHGDFKLVVAPDGTRGAVSLDNGKSWNVIGLESGAVPFYCPHVAFQAQSGDVLASAPTVRQLELEALRGLHRRIEYKAPPQDNFSERRYSSGLEFEQVIADVTAHADDPDVQAAWRDFVVLPMPAPPPNSLTLGREKVEWNLESAEEELEIASQAVAHSPKLRAMAIEAAARPELTIESAEHGARLLAQSEHPEALTALARASAQPATDEAGCRRRQVRLTALSTRVRALASKPLRPEVQALRPLDDDPACPGSPELHILLEVIR